jgi:hypothetical protein
MSRDEGLILCGNLAGQSPVEQAASIWRGKFTARRRFPKSPSIHYTLTFTSGKLLPAAGEYPPLAFPLKLAGLPTMFRLDSKTIWSAWSLTLCILWTGTWSGIALGDPSIVEHAPASSVLAIVSSDLGQTCAEFQRSRLGETLVGADFKPLIAELRKFQLGGPLYLRPLVGFDWSELQNTHTAGGLFIFPLAEGKQGLAWIFAGSAPAGEASPLAAASRYFSAQQFRSSSETLGTAKLTIWTPPASKEE